MAVWLRTQILEIIFRQKYFCCFRVSRNYDLIANGQPCAEIHL